MDPVSADSTVDLDQPLQAQLEALLDDYRGALNACVGGLSEEQARRSLVASKTTLLSLVKHATFVERVWFDQAVTCRTRAELEFPKRRTTLSTSTTTTPSPQCRGPIAKLCAPLAKL